MPIVLRPDQQALKIDVYTEWQKGARNVLGVLSTGGGKSVITSDIVLDGAQTNMQQWVIAHRNELVSQMAGHVARRGIYHRIIGPDAVITQIVKQQRAEFGKSFYNPSAPTAVVGVDTLISRKDNLAQVAAQTQRWIIDEAHHVIRDNKWGKAVDMFPRAHGLGVTATPTRADGQGLGRKYDGVFDAMVCGPSMRELITLGAICDYEIVCPKSDIEVGDDDITATGDFGAKKLKAAAKKSHIIGDVVQAYQTYAAGKRAICFATDVETGGEIAKKFVEAGIPAICLSGETPTETRNRYVGEFKAGRIHVLVNVDLFDEGFDVPACDCVIMARPTASLGKYRQMVGRALRTAPGKLFGLIIDHVSNVIRHGLPDKYVEWSLARRDKRAKQEVDPNDIPLTECKGCTRPYQRFHTCCPYCGFEPPLPEPRSRSIEMVEGDLVLLDRTKLEEMRRATQVEAPASIAERVAFAAGEFAARGVVNKHMDKIQAHGRASVAIAQWAAIERAKGFTDRQLYKKFYLAVGTDVLTALDGKRSRDDLERLAERVEGWYRV